MAGKATLFVVAGFSVIFLVIVQNFGRITSRAVDNYVDYHRQTLAHNIAVSGANVAASDVYFDPSWATGYADVPYQDGILNLNVQYDNTYKTHTIKSIGTFQGWNDTVIVVLAPANFSYYAYFSMWEKESPSGGPIWWTGSDTVWGPFHTEDDLRVYRHPSFLGKSTSHKGALKYYTNKWKDKPIITGDYNPGAHIEIPTGSVDDLEVPADNDGLKFTGQDTVYLKFDRDSLRYRFSFNDDYSALYLQNAAPNGIIFAEDCVVRLQGIVKGQYTVACSSPGSGSGANPNKGIIYLDDDIVYDKDPRDFPGSTDILGICAENSVSITDPLPNSSGINIQGSVFCEKEGFGAQNYDSRDPSGDINLYGGIVQKWRKPVGQFSSSTGTILHGFTKQYRYDERFLLASPPFFPGTGGFKIVSWKE
jgi:hypothetical protein